MAKNLWEKYFPTGFYCQLIVRHEINWKCRHVLQMAKEMKSKKLHVEFFDELFQCALLSLVLSRRRHTVQYKNEELPKKCHICPQREKIPANKRCPICGKVYPKIKIGQPRIQLLWYRYINSCMCVNIIKYMCTLNIF